MSSWWPPDRDDGDDRDDGERVGRIEMVLDGHGTGVAGRRRGSERLGADLRARVVRRRPTVPGRCAVPGDGP